MRDAIRLAEIDGAQHERLGFERGRGREGQLSGVFGCGRVAGLRDGLLHLLVCEGADRIVAVDELVALAAEPLGSRGDP